MSETVNIIASKTLREIKETLQWPPTGKSMVVSTHVTRGHGTRGV